MPDARRRLSAADLVAYAVPRLVDEMRVLSSQQRDDPQGNSDAHQLQHSSLGPEQRRPLLDDARREADRLHSGG
jgi:hypothetical protein